MSAFFDQTHQAFYGNFVSTDEHSISEERSENSDFIFQSAPEEANSIENPLKEIKFLQRDQDEILGISYEMEDSLRNFHEILKKNIQEPGPENEEGQIGNILIEENTEKENSNQLLGQKRESPEIPVLTPPKEIFQTTKKAENPKTEKSTLVFESLFSTYIFNKIKASNIPGLEKRNSRDAFRSFFDLGFKRLNTTFKSTAYNKTLKEIINEFKFDDFKRIKKEETKEKIAAKRDTSLPTLNKILDAARGNDQLDHFLNKKMTEILRDFVIDNSGLRAILENKNDREKFEQKNKDFKIFFKKPLIEFDQNDPTKLKSFGYADLFFRTDSFVNYVKPFMENLDN